MTLPYESLSDDQKTIADQAFDLFKNNQALSKTQFQGLLATIKQHDFLAKVKCDGSTLLHQAASRGYTDLCGLLVDSGADINAYNQNGFTPLHIAATYSLASACFKLLELGANPNLPDFQRNTPLHIAAFRCHARVVQWLLRHGAQVDTYNNRGETAFYSAIDNANQDALEPLLLEGANPHDAGLVFSGTDRDAFNTYLDDFLLNHKNRVLFTFDGPPTKASLFDEDGYLNDDVKSACYAGLFPELICKPLLQSPDPEDHQLLYDVMQALPQKWKNQSCHQYTLLERRLQSNQYDPQALC